MSELSLPENPTKRQIDLFRAAVFDEYIGPFTGEVYLTALNCFPGFKNLRGMSVHFDPESSLLRGGVIEGGEPRIHIGTRPDIINDRMKSRLIERFDLPAEVLEMTDGVFKPLIFAHEMGHVLQYDPMFEQFFGNISHEFPDPDQNYAGYVHSDPEANADFIAAEIMSNSEFGIAVGVVPPAESPAEWRSWASAHQLARTIAAFPDTSAGS